MNKKLLSKPMYSIAKAKLWSKTLIMLLFFTLVSVTKTQAQNFAWGKAIGGTSNDISRSVAADAAGNVYITGYFIGTVDFDPNAGVSNITSAGGEDIFVTKLDVTGNLVWAKTIGGTGADRGYGISVDAAGNVYTTGYFQGAADFDPNAGVSNLPFVGVTDIFVSKLDTNGNLVWAKAMGGNSGDIGFGISSDAFGNVYTTGDFQGTVDFDPNAGVFNLISVVGGIDIFVTKLDTDGNLVWAKAMGGTNSDVGNSISADAAGNVYTTGSFQGTADFDPNAGVTNFTTAGGQDIFVSKLDTAGNLVWAKAMGGAAVDTGNSISTDVAGNVYTTGNFQGTADFDPNAGVSNLTTVGGNDIFVSKLDTAGNLVWAKAIGGTFNDIGLGISSDTAGNTYTTGSFAQTVDFDPNAGVSNLTSAGGTDIFVSKLDTSGNLIWAKAMGGTSADIGYGISTDASGNVYTTGIFTGTADFDPNAGVSNLTSVGTQDIFVHKMSATQGAALHFDGVNDRVSIPNQPVSNLNNFTFEAWIHASAITYQTIYAEGNTSNDNPMFSLTKMPNTSGFEIVLRNSSAVGLVAGSTTGYAPLNTWTHVVFVRTSATTASLYVNGVNTDNFTFADPGSIAVNVANLGIRQRVGFDGWFNGNMDEVRIWNRALAQTEIQNNMNCELSASQTGLVSYYKFNQGIDNANNSTITTLIDASGNTNTGTLNNFALTGTISNWTVNGGVTTGNTCSTFLSTNDFEFSSKLTVYPNPSSDVFSINSDSHGTIVVYDLLGKIIKIENLDSGITKLDLSNYPSGLYLMKATNNNNQTKIMKLIKQ